jgi:hypothetical protein
MAAQGIAQVHVRDRPRRIHLDRILEPARRLRKLVLLVIHEAEIVRRQRKIRPQLERLGELRLGLRVLLFLVQLQPMVVGALRLLAARHRHRLPAP